VRHFEEARRRLVERLIAAGSAGRLATLESFAELRLLAALLWLPRDSAPLRRLGLRIQSPGAGQPVQTILRGPGFELELDNYRFSATTAARQPAAVAHASAGAGAAVRRLSGPDVARAPVPITADVARMAHPLADVEVSPPTRVFDEPVRAVRPPAALEDEPALPAARPVNPARRLWRLPGALGRRAAGEP
jgi:hypothetical protein